MISKFFIEHPCFAFVISIVITLAGLIAIKELPVAQYPNITPSQVSVSVNYPGADATTVEQAIIAPIEAQVNGVKRMLCMSSTSSDSGSATTTVTFGIGTDGDMNTVNVQNRVNWATPHLPEEVQRQGIIVKEKSSNMLLVLSLYSPKGTYNSLWLNNYISLNIKDEISRIPGIGDVALLGGADYAMRIWINPDQLASLNMTVNEVISAIKEQNVQVSSGALGDSPIEPSQMFRYAIQTTGRLSTVEDFKEIIIRSTGDGEQVKLKDVATVEMGAENYASTGQFNGQAAALMAIYQLSDANGLKIAEACYAKLEELSKNFPEDLAYEFNYDTTKFINASIAEVWETLVIAVILVILVTFLFLQDWRSTLIPTVAIPVSLIGTFAFMAVVGYSINLITLFGLILAIGIVVDDAIVVIENINRLMAEEGLDPKTAAIKSMEQVTGPVIATTAVLLAMFVPVCFLSGITGEMYRQFGITISVAVTLSSINALTLSPALSALILKPIEHGQKRQKIFLFRWFDAFFERITVWYSATVARLVKRAFVVLLCYAALLGLTVQIYRTLPTGFVPDEDMGAFFINIQLPDGAAIPRTQAVVDKVIATIKNFEGIESIATNTGFSILTGTAASNNAMVICSLKPWEQRKSKELKQSAIMQKIHHAVSGIPDAVIMPFAPPAIPGIGSTGGFSFVVQDKSGTHPDEMQEEVNKLVAAANKTPAISNAFSTFRANIPQIFLEINREKALKMGVSLKNINSALQGLMGYSYINDFNKFGKVYKVEIQALSRYRGGVESLINLHVPNTHGEMVPLGTIADISERFVPQYLNRYNMYSAVTINGSPAPGYSTGQAMTAMENLADELLPPNMKYDWTDMSFQERLAAGQIGMIMALALLFIYLFLVAQYESWMIPMAVLLSVPIAFFGSLLSLKLLNIDNNIYTQVGFILLFGVACKTAILIVEFAKIQHEQAGMSTIEAAIFAAKLRFRAVLMTAISFILGTFPLVIASGAGAASRNSLGTAIFGGMMIAAIFGTLLIPGFYVAVQRTLEKFSRKG
ncbi:MAG: multidrug efflux RND transporter permease subunit [Victivallaceae bacterium]|nr:multidrug efflux RND transporter permease subunit [Victivallaceae bacterium]